jgi:hypothetical protein
MEVFISQPHVNTKAHVVSDGKDLKRSEDSDFIISTPITTIITNVNVASARAAVVSTAVNSRKMSFSELISPGHSNSLSVRNNANIKQNKQNPSSSLF